MQINEIQSLIHHRPPYLMIDHIDEIDPKHIRASKIHLMEEAHIKGHFPGAPIVPGAMLQEMATQAAGVLITKFFSPVDNYHSEKTKGWALGVLKKVDYAKYISLVKANQVVIVEVELIERVENLFKFKAKLKQDDQIKAKLQFNLVNISDEFLFA